uniref:KRAB domain-containing protein n=1 Tax=Micrurus spixii TaxID=129469 RepID=A0A2D4N1N4_9SAUR
MSFSKMTEDGSPYHSAPMNKSGIVDWEEPLDLFGRAARTKQNILEEADIHCVVQCCPFRELCCQEAEGLQVTCSQLHHLYNQWRKQEGLMKAQMVILQLSTPPAGVKSCVGMHGAETMSQEGTLAKGFLLNCVEQKIQRKQIPVSFEDVIIFFSVEEWALLDFDQKSLYREVMLENAKNVESMGKRYVLLWVQINGEVYSDER